MIAGTEEQKADARALVLDFFDRQATTEGHMIGEIMTTSHCQLWYAFVAAARAVAFHFSDQPVIERTGQWFRRDYYLLSLVAFEDIPVSPGARPAGRHNALRTATYSFYRNKPCPPLGKGWGDPNNLKSDFYKSAYNVSAWIMRELILDGDKLGGTRVGMKEIAVLSDDMDVWRLGRDYVISIPRFRRSGPTVMAWIANIQGVEDDSGVFRGEFENWTCPSFPPMLPGASYVRVQGVRK
jgi:hypothetical protein